jgi:hypothetical protein
MALGSTQSLTEMSTRNVLGGKGRPARKADNLTIYESIFRKCGNLNISKPYGPPRPVTGIPLHTLFFFTHNTATIELTEVGCELIKRDR